MNDDELAAKRKEVIDTLWAGLLERIEWLKATENLHPSVRGPAMVSSWDHHPSHISVSVKVGLTHLPEDGSTENYLITAHQGQGRFSGTIDFRTDHWTSYHEDYWERQLTNRNNAFVAGGKHYRIGEVRPSGEDRSLSGFSGAHATVKFFDGRVVETRNLWFQGPVPAPFRDRLPDDAELIWN